MGDAMISAAPAGQPATPEAAPAQQQPASPQAWPQGNYVTSEQLNASMDEIKRMIQSSTDKSYNRVQKMIDNLKQAGIQNPTYEQAQRMLAQQDQSAQQGTEQQAQQSQKPVSNPEAAQWIKVNGGIPTEDYWYDIYDAAQEAGVGMITREDPEYAKYFIEDGKLKQYQKPRQFVRAFEQAFAEKKQRLSAQQGTESGNLASSPALGSGGAKSSFIDPKTTSANNLITAGLQEAINTRR